VIGDILNYNQSHCWIELL